MLERNLKSLRDIEKEKIEQKKLEAEKKVKKPKKVALGKKENKKK